MPQTLTPLLRPQHAAFLYLNIFHRQLRIEGSTSSLRRTLKGTTRIELLSAPLRRSGEEPRTLP
jgi:hypothetical protein